MEKKKIYVNVKLLADLTKEEFDKVAYLSLLNNRYATKGQGIWGYDYRSKVMQAEYIAYVSDEFGDILAAVCLKDPNYVDEIGDNYLEKMMLETGVKLTNYKEKYLMSISPTLQGKGISKILDRKLETVVDKIYYVSNLDLLDVTSGLIRDNYKCIYTYMSPYTKRPAAIWVNVLEEGMTQIPNEELKRATR